MKWYPTAGDKCLSYNAAKWPYEDITCLYPVLKPFYAEYVVNKTVIFILNVNNACNDIRNFDTNGILVLFLFTKSKNWLFCGLSN